MCEYAAPPQGCSYVRGPNFNQATQCGLILQCGIAQARFVRIESTENGWVSWREIEVYNHLNNRLTHSGTAVTATAHYDGNSLPSYVVDGNVNTAWNAGETNLSCRANYTSACPGASRSAWIQLDFGSVQPIGRVKLLENGNTTSERTAVKVSTDGVNFTTIAEFDPPIADQQWLTFPMEDSSIQPALVMKARLQPNYSTNQQELDDRAAQYNDIVSTPLTTNGGRTEITLSASQGSIPQKASILWRIEDAHYFRLEKSVTFDAALGQLNQGEAASCGSYSQNNDPFMFFAGYGVPSTGYSLSPGIFFPDMRVMPPGPGYGPHTVAPYFCQIGRVYTTKITAVNRYSGRTASYEAVVKVTR